MTSPIVLRGQGQGLLPVMQALQSLQQRQVQAEQLEIQRGRLALAEKETNERIRELRAQRQRLEAAGSALRDVFAPSGTEPTETPGVATVPGKVTSGGAVATPQNVQREGVQPPVVETPRTEEALREQRAGIMARLGASLQGTPSGAIPAVLEAFQPFLRPLLEEEALMRSERQVQDALQNIDDPELRERIETVTTLSRVGGSIPVEVQRVIYGDLLPQDVEPSRLNAAVSAAISSQRPWGEIRRQFDLPARAGGIPDDFVFPEKLAGRGGGEAQRTLRLRSSQMVIDLERIDSFGDDFDLGIRGEIDNFLRLGAAGGSLLALPLDVLQRTFRITLTPEQQAFNDAVFRWANSFRFMISGAQSSDREFISIVKSVAPQVGDSREAKRAKRDFMRSVTERAVEAGGDPSAIARVRNIIVDFIRRNEGDEAAVRMIEIWRQQDAGLLEPSETFDPSQLELPDTSDAGLAGMIRRP